MYNENEGNEEIEFYQVVFPDGAAFNLLHIDWDVQFGLKVMTNQPSSLSLYDGFAFVQPQGHHKFRIGSDQLAALEALVEKYDYFGITEKVDSLMMTDHPIVTTTVVTKDGRKRSIANYHGSDMFPKRLRRFENRIDEIVGFTL
jgi:hypothetical protein